MTLVTILANYDKPASRWDGQDMCAFSGSFGTHPVLVEPAPD